MDYRELNDNEIISYINENNEEANELIFKKYEPLIKGAASRLLNYSRNTGLELNDLVQEGMLGLSLAVNSFNSMKNITFYTYARTCIERKMISLIIQNNRLKHKILNESLSIEVNDEDGDHLLFGRILEDNRSNPEEQLVSKEEEEILIKNVRRNLTDFESQVFDLKIGDFTYKEIADILDKDSKSIDNALQRIKSKVKEQLALMKD